MGNRTPVDVTGLGLITFNWWLSVFHTALVVVVSVGRSRDFRRSLDDLSLLTKTTRHSALATNEQEMAFAHPDNFLSRTDIFPVILINCV